MFTNNMKKEAKRELFVLISTLIQMFLLLAEAAAVSP